MHWCIYVCMCVYGVNILTFCCLMLNGLFLTIVSFNLYYSPGLEARLALLWVKGVNIGN